MSFYYQYFIDVEIKVQKVNNLTEAPEMRSAESKTG